MNYIILNQNGRLSFCLVQMVKKQAEELIQQLVTLNFQQPKQVYQDKAQSQLTDFSNILDVPEIKKATIGESYDGRICPKTTKAKEQTYA